MRVGAVDGCRCGLVALLVHARERLGCVLLELAQLVERGGLLVETGVRLVAQLDDLGVPCAGLLVGVGIVVIELLLERERLVEVLARGLQRLLELGGRGIAELGPCEAEFLVARRDRVVGLDERRRRPPGQLFDADCTTGRPGPAPGPPSCGGGGPR